MKWMFWIGTVKPLIAVAPAGNQSGGFKLGQLILHRLEGEKAQPRQLPDVELLRWIGEQEPENFSANYREQSVQ